MIHFPTYGSHHDIAMACGVQGWTWDAKTPDPDVKKSDGVGDGAPDVLWSTVPAKVTCPICKPVVEEHARKTREAEERIAAAGGIDTILGRIKGRP